MPRFGGVKNSSTQNILVMSILLISLLMMRVLPIVSAASFAPSPVTEVAMPGASTTEQCVHNINKVFSTLSAPITSTTASMLRLAEQSSQYKSAATNASMSLVEANPNIQYTTNSNCTELTIAGYTFSFTYGAHELSIEVDPAASTVLSTLTVDAARHGANANISGSWGGGYSYWDPVSDYNDELTWAEADYSQFTIYNCYGLGVGCSENARYSYWSGLTDSYDGSGYIAQTGTQDDLVHSTNGTGGHLHEYMWTEFYPSNSTDCTTAIASPDDIAAVVYSDLYYDTTASYYVADTWDSTLSEGCENSLYWPDGLGVQSYYAVMVGEPIYHGTSLVADFGSFWSYNSIYDSNANFVSPSSLYDDGDADAYYYTTTATSDSGSGTSATESLDSGYNSFEVNYDDHYI